MIAWLGRVAAWFSQTLNLFLLFGHHDQTISARAHVNQHRAGWGLARRCINRVFFWQPDHCLQSHISDRVYAAEVLGLKGGNSN